jgi:hypothetical protein
VDLVYSASRDASDRAHSLTLCSISVGIVSLGGMYHRSSALHCGIVRRNDQPLEAQPEAVVGDKPLRR